MQAMPSTAIITFFKLSFLKKVLTLKQKSKGTAAGLTGGGAVAVAAGSQAQRHGGSQDKSCYFFKFHFIVLLVNHFSQIIADWVKKIL